MNYQIKIQELKLFGYHGVYPEERKQGQMFSIDLTAWCQNKATDFSSDNLDDVISYPEIIGLITKHFHQQQYQLLETLAWNLLNALEVFPLLQKAEIAICKIHPPIKEDIERISVIMQQEY